MAAGGKQPCSVCGDGPIRRKPVGAAIKRKMRVVLAHLGIHWNADAAEVARMRPHAYVDLTGEPAGWRKRVDAEGLDKYLWWPGAFDKVVFGTDVHHTKMRAILDEDLARVERLKLPPETRQRIFSGNILRLLGLEA